MRRRSRASAAGARLVVTPELSLCGYRRRISCCARPSSTRARASSRRSPSEPHADASSSAFERDGANCLQRPRGAARRRGSRRLRKQRLPNYTVFDEERYFEPGHAPCVIDVERPALRSHRVRGRLVSRCVAAGEAAGSRAIVVANGSPYPRGSTVLRRGAGGGARTETALPFVYVNRSEARTSSCSMGLLRHRCRGGGRATASRVHETVALVTLDGAKRSGARRPRRALRVPRIRGAGDGCARLRRQEPLSGRAARLSGGVDSALDAGVRSTRWSRKGARGDDALAVQRADEPRRRARNGGISRRPLRRDTDRAMFSAFLGRLAGEFKGCPSTLPKRTSRRGSAERC